MFKPILFNTEMVKAILEGRKTQTRRIIRPQPETLPDHLLEAGMNIIHKGKLCKLHVPYGYAARTRGELIVKPVKPPCRPGNILWVRETWCDPEPNNYMVPVFYKADMPMCWDAEDTAHGEAVCITEDEFKWRPSIHMPKDFARIFLRVKEVRVERLKDICDKYEYGPDHPVAKEGFKYTCDFIATWENTIKPSDREIFGWEANPWVWVIEFERIEKPEDWV